MSNAPAAAPARFRDVAELEDFMTAPSPVLAAEFGALQGDLIILGVGGKMGPTLARMAKRAAPKKRVIGVARFSEKGLRDKLTGWGIDCIEADLLDRQQIEKLPKTPNVVFMAGRKFGATGNEDLTWAMNAFVPALVAETFGKSRIVAFSTGNVYPFVNVKEGGATEALPPGASGTYANSCIAREAMFQYFSRTLGNPGRIIRLNYAIDMRYGVLHDIGTQVFAGKPIDLTAGHVNVIWQGDANSMVLRAFGHCTTPSSPLNLTGPEALSVRTLAESFGRRFGKKAQFTGIEAADGWLINSAAAMRLFGLPSVTLAQMIEWNADWIERGMPSLGKETHYNTRDGAF
jgi:nucleoside-diphosphate-sugar epimerase